MYLLAGGLSGVVAVAVLDPLDEVHEPPRDERVRTIERVHGPEEPVDQARLLGDGEFPRLLHPRTGIERRTRPGPPPANAS